MFVDSGDSDPVQTVAQGPGGTPDFLFRAAVAHFVGYHFHFEHEMLIGLEAHQAFRELCIGLCSEACQVRASFQVGSFFRLGLLFRK